MVYRDGKKVDSDEESEDDSGNQTALIPKSLVAGFDIKTGDQIKLKVVHEFDDEIEVEYSHKDKKDKKPKSDMESANDDLESLAT